MNFALTEEQQFIQQTAKRFAIEQLLPMAAELDENGTKEGMLDNLRQLAELGFMGLNISSEYGGSEAGVVAFSLALMELGRGCAATAVTVSVTNMVAEVIQACGSDEQKRDHLPKLCSGEYKAGGFCLTESGAGSDPSGMKCQARRDGDHWVLNGSKIYITSGEYADIFIVWAVTDPQAAKGRGITCFIVNRTTPGISVAKAERKMGQTGSATNEVHFDNCVVPHTAILGEENKGFKIAVSELAGGRIGVGSFALGIGFAAMDYARQYLTERQQFNQRLADFQGLQWMLADRYTELEAARLLLLNAAWLKENNLPFAKAASMAKLFATEHANKACYTALQMLGGNGYIKDYPLERWSRDVRITTIYEGTSEIQRIIIARALLQEIEQ
ncbi:MAG: acyl-CoA dehydrogenase family protein [Porticoccaceae bacterium]